ncbi:MAG: diaminopimelate decarboxylase, partial [Archaeoglobi archaeon]|nr:diaminopimelate decarboxylase [Archaeoglobi archaeon]
MFEARNGVLHIEDVDFREIVRATGTPVYVTSKRLLEENIQAYRTHFGWARLLYAVKANNNLALMRIFARAGFGADVFSAGELYLALLAGFNRTYVLFNGNSKSDEEIEFGVRAGVRFSVDSIDELYTISEIASSLGRTVRMAFRVNPDISPETHPKIATGLRTSKFGIPSEEILEAYRIALELPAVEPVGVHCHIGSQITDTSPFVEELEKMFEIAKRLEEMGVSLEFLDMGGGFGIDYEGDGRAEVGRFASALRPIYERGVAELKSRPELWIEPGRSLVANTTVLITRVNSVKRAYKNFVAVDAGFNLLLRPAMYDAYHRVAVANKFGLEGEEVYTVVGPICESGDVLAKDRKLPRVEKGD